MDREIRRATATRRETLDGNRLGFAAGTQGEGGYGRHVWPPPDIETAASKTLKEAQTAMPSIAKRFPSPPGGQHRQLHEFTS